MIAKENIRIVHVEASSRCNSQCPMCSRYTGHGFVQPDLIEGDLSADVFYKFFTKEFTSQLEHVYFLILNYYNNLLFLFRMDSIPI